MTRKAYQRFPDVVLTYVRQGYAGHSRQKRGPVSASRREMSQAFACVAWRIF